jgi:PTH1 family peptidyl-tRNA hydrolase
MVLDALSREKGVSHARQGFQSRFARMTWAGADLVLLWPMTYMNNSGMAVRAAADYYRIRIADILVIHDDLDIPPGRVKISRGGGAAGHKGIISIISHIGSSEFPRVRVGIGRPRYGEAIEDYVLASCYKDEQEGISGAVSAAVKACKLIVEKGIEAAMNEINRHNLSKEEVSD